MADPSPLSPHPEPLYQESESRDRLPSLMFRGAVKRRGVARGRESDARGKNPPHPPSRVEKTGIEHSLARR